MAIAILATKEPDVCHPNAFIIDTYTLYTANNSIEDPRREIDYAELSLSFTSYIKQIAQPKIKCSAISELPGSVMDYSKLYTCGKGGLGFYALPDKSIQLVTQWICDG